MQCRLATCDGAESTLSDVIKELKKGTKYIFWGNNRACECDYVFVHSQDNPEIQGILKITCVKYRKDISPEDFVTHRPSGWPKEMQYTKYFVVEAAKKVNISRDKLKKNDNQPLKIMHDMNFVIWDAFEPF